MLTLSQKGYTNQRFDMCVKTVSSLENKVNRVPEFKEKTLYSGIRKDLIRGTV